MKLYFDVLRNTDPNKGDNRHNSPIFRITLEDGCLYRYEYKDGKLNGNHFTIKKTASVDDLLEYKLHQAPKGVFVHSTKIKSDKPLKRFLTEKIVKSKNPEDKQEKTLYYCKGIYDNNFEFDDTLLNENEKKYIIKL